jgi:hypothetical protein
MTYEWKWKRAAKRKTFLELLRDGKKIGSVSLKEQLADADGRTREDMWEDVYVAYKGGGNIGDYATMTEAKIAVEKALGVSTKKSKKKPQPERI